MGKKNLEQLFKDTFRDFQEVPDEKVWKSIESSLDKRKQKKRVIPIWWRLGGVAAAAALLFFLIDPLDKEPIHDQTITDTETTVVPTQQDPSDVDDGDFQDPSGSQKTEQMAGTAGDTESAKETWGIEKTTVPSERVAGTDRNHDDYDAWTGSKNKTSKEKNAIASNTDGNSKKEGEEVANQNKKQLSGNLNPNKEVIADNLNLKDGHKDPIGSNKEEDAVALNDEEEIQPEKKSIFDAIKEQQEEEDIVAQSTSGKWSVGPSVAPVYFSAAGNGSPIHSDFASNSKSGNLNLSYGLTVGYDIGKKLKIRSGIHKVNYGYDTNDVVFSSTLRTASNEKFDNIDYGQNSENVVVLSKKSAVSDVTSKEIALSESPTLDGKMVQQLGYIEVPLELNYALVDKKFGVDLIGGVSSLFLIDNSVLLESDELITEIGEANNVNSTNFSANVGMGLNYNFAPKFQLSLEPVFKYQLNTFSKTAGDFRPYTIGVYSGISFKF
ncbi:outer membrane beta-barrel protein [Flagellimonas sediminis]|uniref:Outer membrane beta-barrel protein n=1 Tax=Flagellimonas sediminis TaxID=2696468 RepID=A0A6I5KW36_9FLAO|nr:outer membrane beta-barrel protein [Allomuricauda sediminis]NDV42188.1 outer membrane beta-barrel protein [Allomuricauda sediminis]